MQVKKTGLGMSPVFRWNLYSKNWFDTALLCIAEKIIVQDFQSCRNSAQKCWPPQAKFPIPRMLCTGAVYFRNSLSASSQ